MEPTETRPHGENVLDDALAHAAHLLPDQGPIGVFVHHNTLHGFQHLPFHEAVATAAQHNGARAYLSLEAFHAAFLSGRITTRDLDEALACEERPLPLGFTERSLRLALLSQPPDVLDADGVRFRLSRGERPPGGPLFAACARRLAGRPPRSGPVRPPARHADILTALGHASPDLPVHDELQKLCASFLDQGQAHATMPERERGFLLAVAALYDAGAPLPTARARAFARAAHVGAPAAVDEALGALGVPAKDQPAFLEATLLALPGWAGMFARLERTPGDAHHPPHARLVDFLAVRLVLEQFEVTRACARAGLPLGWVALREQMPAARPLDPLVEAASLARLAEAGGATPAQIDGLDDAAGDALLSAVADFPTLARQRVYQEAYEGWYRRQFLDALAVNRQRSPIVAPDRPIAGFVFCIDEREESTRRAIEEQGAGYLTFGAAGFFGVAIDYQGLDDASLAAYCPAVVVPAHEVREAPVYPDRAASEVRKTLRSARQWFGRRLDTGTRTLTGGALQSLLLGPFLGARIASTVAAPRESARLGKRVSDALVPQPATRLESLRLGAESRGERGKWIGFTAAEKADRVTALLVNIGLVDRFPPVVVILGHGSTSLNNPHESAHDCGACGGRRGGANARLFAEMANRPEVRAAVRARGVPIPDDTWFIGALHDTSDDGIQYFDLDDLPATHAARFDHVVHVLDKARREDARERARRFETAPLGISADAALAHVEARAASLAQPRPEYGHCTNAIAVVGRRSLTRSLFLDRRAFLISYDATIDPECAVIERILAAVGPVGAGINLEYWFSSVDNEVYGCGTKLPHNVTGLLGVMNGHQSDLRTGLPWQMVEIHEPMRLLLLVEATPEALLTVAGRQREVRELVVNAWVQLVSVHPETGAMARFHNGGFVPYTPDPVTLPSVARSFDWYRHTREHLGPALIEAGRV